jgi:predicted nucleic-acid-binding protein
MIGLDTNILIRYLTQDNHTLSPKATALIEHHLSPGRPGFITVVTMAEVAWVLDSFYSLSSAEIADAIERILSADALVVEREHQVFEAMTLLRKGAADFADALIGLLAQRAGCSHTLTFDRKASRLPGFELLS